MESHHSLHLKDKFFKKTDHMENLGTFKIAEPCHANWNEMTAATQGRFCASCQKCVVDFTQKTSAEIKAVYDENAGNVCGRVKASQVVNARPAWHARPAIFRAKALKGLQMFALALLTTFGFMLHTEVKAQDKMIMGKIAYVPERHAQAEAFGRVVLESGKPAAGATVLLEHDGMTVAESKTDAEGMYRFRRLQSGQYQLTAYSNDGQGGSMLLKVTEKSGQHEDLRLEEPILMGGLRHIPNEPAEPKTIITTDDHERLAILEPVRQDLPVSALISTNETVPPIGDFAAVDKVLDDAEAISLADFELKVFPNPTTDKITLVVDKAGTDHLQVTVFSIDGRVMFEGIWQPSMENRKTLELQSWPSGIYLLRLTAGDQVVQRQLLKI